MMVKWYYVIRRDRHCKVISGPMEFLDAQRIKRHLDELPLGFSVQIVTGERVRNGRRSLAGALRADGRTAEADAIEAEDATYL